jgi:voltage-gated potassium channel
MKNSLDRNLYRYLVGAAIAAVGIGTTFYHLVEHLSWLNAYYFSIVTLTTVGYGDIVPHTAAGKIFTTIYLLIGIGIITTFISVTMRRRGEKFEQRRKND